MQALIDACLEEDGKLYLCVSSPTIKDKPVSNSSQLLLFQSTYAFGIAERLLFVMGMLVTRILLPGVTLLCNRAGLLLMRS